MIATTKQMWHSRPRLWTLGPSLRLIGLAALCVAFVVLCASCASTGTMAKVPAQSISCSLTYVHDKDIRKTIGYVGGQGSEATPRGGRKASNTDPLYFSKRPLSVMLALGDAPKGKGFLIVFDESLGTGSGYDTCYFDANGNGDLKDDPQIAGTPRKNKKDDKEVEDWRGVTFELENVMVPIDGVKQRRDFQIDLSNYGSIYVQWHTTGYYKGDLKIGKETYPVALLDTTSNGKFGDRFASPEGSRGRDAMYGSGDSLVIDLNHDGKFEKKYEDTAEGFTLGKYFSFGGQCFELEVSAAGDKIALTPTKVPCGYIKSDAPQSSLTFVNKDGGLKVLGSDKTKVPVGEYRLLMCSFTTQDKQKHEWAAAGRGSMKMPAVKVDENKVASVAYGPPFEIKTTVKENGDRNFKFDLKISGRGHEEYSGSNFTTGARNVAPPRIKVRDANGDTVASGRFEYG